MIPSHTDPYRGVLVALLWTTGLLALACCGGCNDADWTEALDPGSQARLERIPESGEAMISVVVDDDLATHASTLPPGVNRIAELDQSLLLVVPMIHLNEVAAVDGVTGGVIWGDGTAAQRIGIPLQRRLLAQLASSAPDSGAMDVIARFRDDARIDRETITASGAEARSLVGPVATLSATPDAIFNLLAVPGLLDVKLPTQSKPLGGGE